MQCSELWPTLTLVFRGRADSNFGSSPLFASRYKFPVDMFDTLFIHYLFWKKLNIQIVIWIIVINVVCRIGVVQDSTQGLGSLSFQLA